MPQPTKQILQVARTESHRAGLNISGNGSVPVTPASVADTLRAARKLIETPEQWTQGMYAKNARGKEVIPYEPTARRWCMTGALIAVEGSYYGDARNLLRTATDALTISIFNDDPARTHPEVLAACDRAIAAAEAEARPQ